MFTWIQNVMQRHYKWLFSILLAIIIVAFVFTIGNTGGVGSGNPADIRREFYGFNLNSQRDMTALTEWTQMSSALMGRRLSAQNREAAMMQRAVTLSLANQLQIPEPSAEQMAAFLKGIPAFQDPATGRFSRDRYTQVVDQAQSTPNGEERLSLVLHQDWRIQQVVDALGGPGYVLPYMAQRELVERKARWSIEVAELNPDSFSPVVESTPEAIEAFYENNTFRYETGPQLIVSFVAYPAEKYLDQVEEPTAAQLNSYYNANRAQWPKDDDGRTLPLAEVKDEVQAAWKLEQAREAAIAAANELAVEAYNANYDGELEATPDSITAFLKQRGLKEETLRPFPQSAPEKILQSTESPFINEAASRVAASLRPQRFYSDAIPVDDGASVLFLREELPSTVPPLEQVRIQVVADYAEAERKRQFNEKSLALKADLEAAVKAGKSFQEAAEAEGLEVQSYEDFTMMSPPEGVDYFILSAIQGLQPGEISDLMSIGTLGTFIYVEDKKVPKYALDSEEVTENMEALRKMSARLTTQSIVNDLITVGLEKATPREF